MRWYLTDRGDQRCRRMADLHYTRQTPGAKQWLRPGWALPLWTTDGHGQAAFAWWRPKWESGIQGTERKDGLRCIECVIFRNGTRWKSSELIREATAAVLTWEHALDVDWPDGLITGVNSNATAARRGKGNPAGWCFRAAGWVEMAKTSPRADVWLRCEDMPQPCLPRIDDERGQVPFDIVSESR